jgi:HD-GYP domain-containing protein (c-di-GMP phosphodiesterase class II)
VINAEVPPLAVSIAQALLTAVKHKDPFTFEHCCRVGRAARKLGEALSLSEFEQTVLEYTGLFHDIGKIGISDSILLKPGRLDNDEIVIMKNHAELSVEMLEPFKDIPFFRFLIPGVRFHHEKFDGSGYPHNVAGENIPLTARIVSIVDTVDAMMNTRPYRKALSFDTVVKELKDFSGTQFDKNIVTEYLQAVQHWSAINDPAPNEKVIAQIFKKSA